MSWLQGFLQDPRGLAGTQPQPNSALGILGGALTGGQLATNIFGAFNQPQYNTGQSIYQMVNNGNYAVPTSPIPQNYGDIPMPKFDFGN